MLSKLIQEFLNKFCIRVSEEEDIANTELYMDNHDYIEYEGKGYYINSDNSMFSEEDQKLCTLLINTYSI